MDPTNFQTLQFYYSNKGNKSKLKFQLSMSITLHKNFTQKKIPPCYTNTYLILIKIQIFPGHSSLDPQGLHHLPSRLLRSHFASNFPKKKILHFMTEKERAYYQSCTHLFSAGQLPRRLSSAVSVKLLPISKQNKHEEFIIQFIFIHFLRRLL